MLRFSKWLTRSASRLHAHATPPSRNAKRSSGKRVIAPPKNSDRHTASVPAAKLPMWLAT